MQTLIYQNDPHLLRQEVHRFIVSSKHPRILEYRRMYDEVVSVIDERTWTEYWGIMVKNYEWVDYIFVQSTAWFLGHDIIIVTTTSTESHPYITISGNLQDENKPCPANPLIIGSKSQIHFQSLLPIRMREENRGVLTGLPANTIKLKVLSATYDQNSNHDHNLDAVNKSLNKNDYAQVPNLDSQEHFPSMSGPRVIPYFGREYNKIKYRGNRKKIMLGKVKMQQN